MAQRPNGGPALPRSNEEPWPMNDRPLRLWGMNQKYNKSNKKPFALRILWQTPFKETYILGATLVKVCMKSFHEKVYSIFLIRNEQCLATLAQKECLKYQYHDLRSIGNQITRITRRNYRDCGSSGKVNIVIFNTNMDGNICSKFLTVTDR